MKTPLESSSFPGSGMQPKPPLGRFRVRVAAVTSVLAGGLLAAWWYRKTIKKLHQAEAEAQNPHFGILDGDPADES
jgi:hypothetical protein